jgi:signal transduction histidine kinase
VATLRTRLTVAYGFALIGGLIVFAIALWTVRVASGIDALGPTAIEQADRVLEPLRAWVLNDHPLLDDQTTADSAAARRSLTGSVLSILGRVSGYFILYDRDGKELYTSIGLRQLTLEDRSAILATAKHLEPNGPGALVVVADPLFDGKMLLVARRDSTLLPDVSRVVSGVPTTVAELGGDVLLGSMLVVIPLILIAFIGVSYFVTGRALEPIDELMNEVEAITDGRSLHRRLPADLGSEELSRLGNTLNAMISRLETSFGALRRFTADASHELKTPLTVLRADVERAMHPGARGTEAMQALEEALQETTRMSDLVDSLLTLARADEGRFDLHREPVPLGPLVRDVYETAMILGEESGLTVSMSVLEEGVVDGDARRLRQLFLNLITNAIKYTPSGGRVELSLSQRVGDEVAFTVRDTGIGMSAADLSHVFERFWRADRARSRTSERGGFGLGLAISQWIAQAHGGRIAVQSRLGRGSVFTVTLPLLTSAGGADENSARSEPRDSREARELRDTRNLTPPSEHGTQPTEKRRSTEIRDIGD